jgi:hypothetical protein
MTFFNYFFAESESLLTQEPVTRDFLNHILFGWDIRLLNISAYAQPAMKSFLRMPVMKSFPRLLSMHLDAHVKTVKIWKLAEHPRKKIRSA